MKRLAAGKLKPKSIRAARSAKGWTPERRARQAERTRLAQPWRHSTGPKTEAGKARVAMNGFRHGCRGRVWLERARRIRRAIRLCAETVLLVRALMLLPRGAAVEAQPETSTIPAWTRSARPATGFTTRRRPCGSSPLFAGPSRFAAEPQRRTPFPPPFAPPLSSPACGGGPAEGRGGGQSPNRIVAKTEEPWC